MNAFNSLGKELIVLMGGLFTVGLVGVLLLNHSEVEEVFVDDPFSAVPQAMDYANEDRVGALFVGLYVTDESRIDDSLINLGIQSIANRLLQALDTLPYDYHFYIVRENEANAFTLPGGRIILNSGLLNVCDTPEALAAVMAHEIGHAQMRHVVDRMITELGLSLSLSVLSGGDPTVLHECSRWLLSNVFHRSQERAADAFALELLEKASVDPSHLGSFFQKAEDNALFDVDASWISTHPGNDDRIALSNAYRTMPGFKEDSLKLNWGALQRRLSDI